MPEFKVFRKDKIKKIFPFENQNLHDIIGDGKGCSFLKKMIVESGKSS